MSGRLGTKGNFSPKDISPLADNVIFKLILDPASDNELKYPFPLNNPKDIICPALISKVQSILNPTVHKLLLTWCDIGRNVAILVLSIHNSTVK